MAEPIKDVRTMALRRFALAISILNILGHTVLGFEQSWAQPIVALLTTYSLELAFEWIDARAQHRRPRYLGGPVALIDFLLSAHITALAIGMLLYTNERLGPTVFAAAVAICSKFIFRAPVGNGTRHYFNPSNFGITITLLAFPWVGIAPPYHFTENLTGIGDWLLPMIIITTGSLLNSKLTRKIPLILSWLVGFAAQAVIRGLLTDQSIVSGLVPMTGMAFVLFTFYMVTDPGTTPSDPRRQILFGASIAVVYGLLLLFHIVFGLFFALTIVCTARGLLLHASKFIEERRRRVASLQPPVRVGGEAQV